MDRRSFLTQVGGAALALSSGMSHSASGQVSVAADWGWRLGYRSIDRDVYTADVTLEGAWPDALDGVYYRNGPARHEVAGYRYRHWFDGDGLVQRFEARAGRLVHRAVPVATAKRSREQELGRAALPAFGSLPPDPVGVTRSDDLNPANISMLWHHQRLFALWEAGSPHELDPDTLATLGPHRFSREATGLPFSAHPRVEPEGTLWNFGYASESGRIVLWHLDSAGRVVNLGLLEVGRTGMPHDFIVTERYLVLLLSPLHRVPGARPEQGFLGLHRWFPERATRVLVLDKNDFSLRRELELPAQWIFHFGNGYDDGPGIVRFDAARHEDPSIMQETFRGVMDGHWIPNEHARWHEYRLDLNRGTASEQPVLAAQPGADPIGIGAEFPRIDPAESGRAHRRVVLLTGASAQRSRPGDLNRVSCWYRDTDRLDSYAYPDSCLVEEHLLVPDPRRADGAGGWVLGTALDWQARQTLFNVFRADDLAAGPVAHGRLPYALPLGLHGAFVPRPA